MGGFVPIINTSTGRITGYKTDIGGADTVFPFCDLREIINLPTAILVGVANIQVQCIIKNNNKVVTSNTTQASSLGFTCVYNGGGNCYIQATTPGEYLIISNGNISIREITGTTILASQLSNNSHQSCGVIIAVRLKAY